MYLNKFLSISGIILSVSALLSLVLPLFSFRILETEMIIRGYNVVEFSPWGSIVLVAPILLIGLMLSKLKYSFKTIGILSLLILDFFALSDAYSVSYTWALQETTNSVQPHAYHLFYALAFVLSGFCFYMECNYCRKGNKMKIKDFFLKDDIKAEPIDYTKEKFFLCSKLYEFAKYKENGDEINSKCNICFATSEGYFATLDDNDNAEYHNVEVLGDNTAIGFVIKNMPTGIFGRFYEDFDFRKEIEMKIKEYPDIKKGKAEIWAPTEDGFVKSPTQISPLYIDDVKLKIDDALPREDMIGSVVVQDGELVAIVTEYDGENKEYKCITAELMAIDLCRKIYEQRVSEALNERKSKKQISN